MKICHAFLFFSIKFAGGTSDLMYKICKRQAADGHSPVVYSGDYNFDQDLADTLPKVQFKVLKSYLDAAGFSIMPDLPKLADKDVPHFDVVHMHVFRTFQNYVLWKKCKKYGIPFIMDPHGAVPYGTRKRWLKRLFDKLWGRQILHDAAFCVSGTHVGAREYKECAPDLPDDNIVILPQPFEMEQFKTIPERGLFRQKYGIADDKKVIMFLGRVHHIKGNDFLVKGFAEYAKNNDDALLVIVGPDDGHMDACKDVAEELGVKDKVIFTGFLGGDDKNSALRDADIVCQMSRQEHCAWAPFEAVMCGTPVIVTEHTGSGEDVQRADAGYTVVFDDVKGLSAKFEYVFAHYDEALAKVKKAQDYITKNMSMDALAKEYEGVYARAIEKTKKA